MRPMASTDFTLKSRPLTLAYQIPAGRTRRFWEGLREGKVYATRCPKCRKTYFPPAADCPNCLTPEMDWIELSGEAEIEAFTRIETQPASFQEQKPYTVAIGRMKSGVKVLAWLVDAELKDIRVGMKARLTTRVMPDGEPTYVFVPAA